LQNDYRYKIAAVSLGCDKNRIDTEEILALLGREGYIISADPAAADLVIVNTCAFIEEAQQESIATLLKLARHRRGRKPLIIAAGCLAEHFGARLLEILPELAGVIGVHSYSRLVEFIQKCRSGQRPAYLLPPPERYCSLGPRLLTSAPFSVYVKIAEGCNNRCRYCLIPSLRGPLRSRPAHEIVNEVCDLVKGGAREVNLIAQDTTAYGTESGGAPALTGLIKQILDAAPDLPWLRILYAYPSRIDAGLIELMATEPRLCRYLDMPLQHIHTELLRRMGRTYSREDVIALITTLRSAIPDLALRTTFMTGFPGETRAAFEALKQFLIEYPLQHVGVFAYSSQKGTAAALMKEQVPRRVALKRRRELLEQQQKISLQLNRALIGKRVTVLVERRLSGKKQSYYGRTAAQAPAVDGGVYFRSREPLAPGDFITLTITAAAPYHLFGANPAAITLPWRKR
jgi:ribosomal protein S12 methylthiotransferase